MAALGNEHNAVPHVVAEAAAVQRDAEAPVTAGPRAEQPGRYVQQGALARAVDPDHGDRLGRRQLEADAAQRLKGVVPVGDVVDDKRLVAHGRSLPFGAVSFRSCTFGSGGLTWSNPAPR